jgi:hypothetical protein
MGNDVHVEFYEFARALRQEAADRRQKGDLVGEEAILMLANSYVAAAQERKPVKRFTNEH